MVYKTVGPKIHKLICLIPMLWLGLLATYLMRATFALGRLPRPYQPDPKDLGFVTHHLSIYLVFLAVLGTIALWPLSRVELLRRRIFFSRHWDWLFVGSFALVCFLVVFDPGQFLEWFMD